MPRQKIIPKKHPTPGTLFCERHNDVTRLAALEQYNEEVQESYYHKIKEELSHLEFQNRCKVLRHLLQIAHEAKDREDFEFL